MSALVRVRLVRAILAAGIGVRALLWGTAVASSVITGGALADVATPLSVVARRWLVVLAIVAALATTIALLWRDRRVTSLLRVALWLEEREPSLEYALVSAVETGRDDLVHTSRAPEWSRQAIRRSSRATLIPFGMLVIIAMLLLSLPRGAIARIRSPHAGDALDRAGARPASASRLSPLVARVRPPPYTREPERAVDEPSDVSAAAGSIVVIEGAGDAAGINGVAGNDTLRASQRGDRWTITLTVKPRAEALRLIDRTYQRIVAIESTPDDAPRVTMLSPAHDSVVHRPRGRIELKADIADDFGVASAAFEYIVSSGEGEAFTFKSGSVGAAQPNAKRSSIAATLSLDSLALKPGDIVHVRAIARDANDVTGPGLGVSETRVIRVARADEYDSVAVEAAAPADEDKSVISERMLIQLADALAQRQAALPRDTMVRESRAVAVDQKRLRRAVGDLVFMRLGGAPSGEEHTGDESPARTKTMDAMLARADSATNRSIDPIDFEGGESPVVSTNKPLLEAYSAMWDASTQLELGEPASALPHMRRALAAIQRARQAERVYLRGRAPDVVLDLDRIRLKGKEKGASSVRTAAPPLDSADRVLNARLLRAIERSSTDAHAMIDSLLVMRIDALIAAPSFANALGDAVRAMRGGRGADATSALTRARRALAGSPIVHDSLTRWGMVP